MSDEIYTVAELAERLRFKTTKPIYAEIHAGRLRARQLPSGDFRIDGADVAAWWDAMIFDPGTAAPSRARQEPRPSTGVRRVTHPKRSPFRSKPGPSLIER